MPDWTLWLLYPVGIFTACYACIWLNDRIGDSLD